MNFDDEQLVARIAEQVIKAIGQRGIVTPIHPPVGQCTAGDVEPAAAASPESSQPPAPPAPPAPSVLRLAGIVTEQQLRDAIAQQGTAPVAHDARLTPLAADFAREHPSLVQRSAASDSATGHASLGRWLYWADGHCSSVQSAVASHRQRLLPSGASRTAEGLVQAVRSLTLGVAQGDVVGGLLFVSGAARPGVLVGACANLRAVVGTGDQAVKQAIDDISPNVLIVEYSRTAEQTLASMVKQMMAQIPKPQPQLMQQLNTLRGLS